MDLNAKREMLCHCLATSRNCSVPDERPGTPSATIPIRRSAFLVLVAVILQLACAAACREPGAGRPAEPAPAPPTAPLESQPPPTPGHPSAAQEPVADDIVFADIYLPREIETWYDTHGRDATASHTWKVNSVHAAPESSSEVLGTILVRLEPGMSSEGAVRFHLDYLPSGSTAGLPWLSQEEIGAWGYGIDVFILAKRGSWVSLPPRPFPANAWINLADDDEHHLLGDADSIIGRKPMRLDAMEVTNAKTKRRQRIRPGVYVMTAVEGGVVRFRPEIPSDMPCGEDVVDPPAASVPSFTVPLQELLDKDKRLRATLAYPRGC